MKLYFNELGTGPFYNRILRALIGEPIRDKTLIDLCCGSSPTISEFKMKRKVFIDNTDRGLKLIYNKDIFIKQNVLEDHEIFNNIYDISIASDAIEHFYKEDGYKLLNKMKAISNKQILCTPLGYLAVFEEGEHKSGWYPEDIPGYAYIICPKWHWSVWKKGALFFWKIENLEKDFERVRNELKDITSDKPL